MATISKLAARPAALMMLLLALALSRAALATARTLAQQQERGLPTVVTLPAETLVLPSHGRPFTGLHTRIDQLHAHHEARLTDAWDACAARPCSAAELLPVLFRRPLDLHQTTFAMGEAVAHAHALWARAQVTPVDGSDGVRRWRAVAR